VNFTGEVESVLLATSLLGSGGVELLGFFEAEALGVDVDLLGAVDETIDEGDDARGVREDLAPGGKGLVGAEEKGLLGVVSAGDDLEEEVGVAAVVREVADLVDAQQVRDGVAAETAGERGGTSAPFSAAPMALSVTRRASSTQQSEYSKPRVYWSRIGVPSGSRRRSSMRVPGSFLRPPRWS